MLDDKKIRRLSETLEGPLIDPQHEGYDEARRLYNAMIDKRPRLIVRAKSPADVRAALLFARDEGLPLAVRGGGHNGPGLALVDDGLVIDLSPMKGIEVDAKRRRVRVEAGCVWREVDRATHEHGLATVSGIIASTGVSGLTLGGGHGYLTRRHGLSADNLLEAEVVLADGEFVRASAEENPDLFWALRGGGGNFGVVTAFTFALHPVDQVVGGPMFWPLEALEPTLRWYREWLPRAPESVYAFYLLHEVPPAEHFPSELHGRKVCGLQWCCLDAEAAKGALDEARAVAEPLFEHVGPLPYPALQSMFDELYAPGLQWYWKGDFVREIPDEAIAEHVRHGAVPTTHSTMHLYPIDGAAQQVRREDTAWSQRDANWSMVIAGVAADPSDNGKTRAWARDYWQALHPHTLGGSYVNFMMEEGDERVRASYGANYPRLREVKAKYDPQNLFRVNQNIPPAR